MIRHEPLTLDQVNELFYVDDINGTCRWRNPPKHHPRLYGKDAGGARKTHSKKYWVIKVGGVAYKRSQIILLVATGVWPGDCVDHINGDSLDDRAENLRHATAIENAWNHKKRAKVSDLPMGVRTTPRGGFQARIGYFKKQISLGVFATPEAASIVYQQKRKELFRDFH